MIADLAPFGPGEQAALIAPALHDQFDVDFFCLSQGWLASGARPNCDEWSEYELGVRNWLGAARQLWTRLQSKPYSIIHSWDWRSSGLVGHVIPWTISHPRRGHWISQADEMFPFDAEGLIRHIPAFRSPDWTIGDPFRLRSGRILGPATEIPAAVAAAPERNEGLRTELGWGSEINIVGTVCPLEARFGLKHLIWAVDQIKCIRDDLRLVVWGSGSAGATLKRFARQVGVLDWIDWRSAGRDVRREMAGLDLYWHAPRDTAMPNALASALMLGLPSIAARTEATTELAGVWPKTLATVAWGARDEIARHTNQWLKKRPAVPLESACPAWIREHSPAAIAQQYGQVYRQLLGD